MIEDGTTQTGRLVVLYRVDCRKMKGKIEGLEGKIEELLGSLVGMHELVGSLESIGRDDSEGLEVLNNIKTLESDLALSRERDETLKKNLALSEKKADCLQEDLDFSE